MKKIYNPLNFKSRNARSFLWIFFLGILGVAICGAFFFYFAVVAPISMLSITFKIVILPFSISFFTLIGSYQAMVHIENVELNEKE